MSASLAALLSHPLAAKTAPSARLPLRRASHLLALEQRFMFDGAAVADAAHAAGDAAVLAQIAAVPAAVEVRAADPALDNGKKEAVLVDTSVADYKTLEAGIAAGMAIIEFDGSQDGLAQIAKWAAGQSGYDAIHIFSHGSKATLNLGTTVLTNSRLADSLVRAELAELGHALKAGGDLLLYGCDLAANSDGVQFLSDLAAATGADVAASTDATGAAAKGGDWTLEAATGAIEATAISAERMADFGDVLAVVNLDGPVTSGNKTWNGSSGADTFKLNSSESYAGGTSDGSSMDQVGNFITNFQVATDVIDFSAVVSDFTASSIVLSKVAAFRDPAVNQIVVTAAKSDGTLASTAAASGTTGTLVTVSGNGAWYTFFLSGVNYTDLTLSNFFFAGPSTTVTGASLSADTGSSNSDFITNTASQTISGTLSTNLATGERVEVSYDGGSTWSNATTYTVGSSSWSTTTTLSGSNTFKARVTDSSGSSSAYSHAYTLENTAPTVSNVTASTANGSYKVGDTVSIQVAFSESVTVTGTPQLTLETGSTDRVINYASGSGSNTLTFTYTVQAGDTSADLDYLSTTALALNGGAITDTAGNNATLTLASPGTTNSLGANKAIVVDGVIPTVSSVTASTANGSYKVGDTVSIQVAFSESVTVTGTPQLTLETGSTDRVINYASGSGSNTLTFTYTVQAGDTSADLDYLSTTALALNGGAITDTAGNNATLTLASPGTTNSLGANKAIVVDGVIPTVSSVTASTANGSYKVGDTVSIQVAFSESVTVTGTPQLTLETGSTDRVINYASGSGSNTLTFTYTVQAGDTSADLDYLSTTALALNGGAITDTAGNNATLTLASPGTTNSLGANKAIVVDGVIPTVSSVTASTANGSYKVGDTVSIQVAFSESVTVTGTPQLTLETGSTDRVINYASGSGSNTLTFTYTVQAGDTSADLDYLSTTALALNGGAITDTAGNNATLTLASPGTANSLGANKAIVIDTTAPNAPSAPDLVSGSDSGSSSTDNITSTTTPTFSGTAETGSTVTLYDTDGSTVLGTTTATGGSWSIVSSNLSAGSHTITVKATDTAGNTSAASTGLTVTIDTTAPTGLSPTTLNVTATSASSTATIATLSATDTQAITYSLATGNGSNDADNGSFTISGTALKVGGAALSAGTYHLYVAATDAAGNVTNQAVTVTVTNAPSITSVVRAGGASATVAGSATSVAYTVTFSEAVTGVDASDFTLTGTGNASGSISNVSGSGTTYTVTVNTLGGDGTLRLDLNSSGTGIQNGSSVAVTGGYTAGATYTLDHTAPTNTIATVAFSADTGLNGSDLVTQTASQTISGTLSANLASSEIVQVSLDNGATWATATTTVGQNTWSLSGQSLSSSNTLKVKVSDAAGNDGTVLSRAFSLDGSAPTVASATVNGNTVVLTYNETLASGVTPQTSEYVVKVGGTTVTVNVVAYDAAAKTVTLTLATAVTSTDTVTVTYTANGTAAQKVQDAAGNLATDLTDRAVTNNTAAATTQVPPPVVVTDSAPSVSTPPPTPVVITQQAVPVVTPPSFTSTIVSPVNTGTSLTSGLGDRQGSDGVKPIDTTPTLTRGSNNGFQVVVKSGTAGGDSLLVNRPLGEQPMSSTGRTEITIPADTFAHNNPNAVVTLSATQGNGARLPSWVSFDAAKGKFVLTPPPGFKGDLIIKVTATDSAGRTVVTTLKVNAAGTPASAALSPGRPGLSEQLRVASGQGDILAALRLALQDHAATLRG